MQPPTRFLFRTVHLGGNIYQPYFSDHVFSGHSLFEKVASDVFYYVCHVRNLYFVQLGNCEHSLSLSVKNSPVRGPMNTRYPNSEPELDFISLISAASHGSGETAMN